jgi:uncharacterized GH25 family protein
MARRTRNWPAVVALLTTLVVVAFAGRALAHDYWILPAEFTLAEGRDIDVALFVGDHFVTEQERPFERARFSRLAHVTERGTVNLLDAASEGARPMLRLEAREDGGHLVVVDRPATHIELEPSKFEEYLTHEGLDSIVEARARLGETSKPGLESYSRCLKSLIQVGDARDETFGTVIGQTLEIVPGSNPAFAKPGSVLPVTVHFRGAPLVGAKLTAFSLVGSDVRETSYTTDESGLVSVAIDREGVWLIRLVHMVRCEACEGADWESFWASYSFAPAGTQTSEPSANALLGDSRLRWVVYGAAGLIVVLTCALVARRRKRSPGGR